METDIRRQVLKTFDIVEQGSTHNLPPMFFDYTNIDGSTRLRLRIEGYEFPEIRCGHDANWCLLHINVTHGSNTFDRTDPALQTTDLIQVIIWVDSLMKYEQLEYTQLCFLEPGISFEHIGWDNGNALIEIELDFELKPNFPLHQLDCVRDDRSIVFALSKAELERIIDSLDLTLIQFPSKA